MTEPGEKCQGCGRRVPHPKKPTTPSSKTVSFRVPLDDVEAWKEALDAAAEHVGLFGKPYHQYRTLSAGLVLLLQEPCGELGG